MLARHAGRHRAPGYNPLSEIVDIASRSAQPAMKASAVAVASGGLVASFAIPASAAGSTESASASGTAAAAPAAAPPLAVAAPKVAATKAPTFGVVGFSATSAPAAAPTAVKITKIKKAVAQPVRTRASRSATRTTPAATTTSTPAAAPAAAPAPTGGIVGIAASLSGVPYRYGGSSPSGFDCSGFTGYVYRMAGISLPRTAAQQQSFATRVANPAPGDLVFFGYPAYHVGIYAGPGQLYDAQRPGTTTGLHSIWTSNNVSYGRVG